MVEQALPVVGHDDNQRRVVVPALPQKIEKPAQLPVDGAYLLVVTVNEAFQAFESVQPGAPDPKAMVGQRLNALRGGGGMEAVTFGQARIIDPVGVEDMEEENRQLSTGLSSDNRN